MGVYALLDPGFWLHLLWPYGLIAAGVVTAGFVFLGRSARPPQI
jgi:hypothetical protein